MIFKVSPLRFLCAGLWLFAPVASFAETSALPSVTTAALVQGALPTPWGWRDFCRKNPVDCTEPKAGTERLVLTPALWKLVDNTNKKVNQNIEAVSDLDHWGKPESWDYPSDGKGDCEDLALLKRGLLIRDGIPASTLLMTIVINRKREGHAVLTLVTDRGDFILDNQIDDVLSWEATGYRYVERQSSSNPNQWLRLSNDVNEILVASPNKKSAFE